MHVCISECMCVYRYACLPLDTLNPASLDILAALWVQSRSPFEPRPCPTPYLLPTLQLPFIQSKYVRTDRRARHTPE